MADCDEVAARMNANMKAYRERLHARGLCIQCRSPLEPERAQYMLCETCARKQRLISRARTERLKADGLCVWCGFRKAVDGATMCRTCKLRQAERMKKLREELSARGLCVNCGFRQNAPGIRMCRVCSMRCHESYERRKERLGIHQGKQGSHPKYTYIIYDPNGRDEIFRGTAIECAKRFFVIDWTIHKAGKVGRKLLGIYPIVRIPWEGADV